MPTDWPRFLIVALLVMTRMSGLMIFGPIFSSSAIAPRLKPDLCLRSLYCLPPRSLRYPMQDRRST